MVHVDRVSWFITVAYCPKSDWKKTKMMMMMMMEKNNEHPKRAIAGSNSARFVLSS